jgi:deoxyribodipyrimidine photolyase-related protein
VRLILVLGDQLSDGVAALAAGDRDRDLVVMAEVGAEATYAPHHPKKIAFLFAAMRKFAVRLTGQGWRVAYSRLDDPDNSQSIPGELLRRSAETGATEVIATAPGEWRLINALRDMPLTVRLLQDRRFIASHQDFDAWAEGKKALRMEFFYREMRRKTGLLMDSGEPAGGQWNFDHDNRKPATADARFAGPVRFESDPTVAEVLDLVAARFAGNFGDLRPFWFATDHAQADRHLTHWLAHGLPGFGATQDAMRSGESFLNHAVIGLYLNAGLLDPLDVCRRAEQEWQAGRAPLAAVEGFIRQIIGWREFVRGIYFRGGPDYPTRNALGATRALPPVYWGAPTKMACMAAVVRNTRQNAYAHHIERLMVTGNFALLAGIDPVQVNEWYLAVYADAYEWVEAPNVTGMALFADGGIIASKPYAASGAYIDRMSDHCATCAYRVQDKTGPDACPFNLLYWDFIDRHADRFRQNPRMAVIVRGWDKAPEERKARIRAESAAFLRRLDAGESV